MAASTQLSGCNFTSCMIYGEDKATVPSVILSQQYLIGAADLQYINYVVNTTEETIVNVYMICTSSVNSSIDLVATDFYFQ